MTNLPFNYNLKIGLTSMAILTNAAASENALIEIDYPVSEVDLVPELEPAMAAKEQGIDYIAPARGAWKKDVKELERFLKLSVKLKLDGAASEIHHEVLTHLLLRWGDVDFAKAIPPGEAAIIADLKRRFSIQQNFPLLFPDTAKVLGIPMQETEIDPDC